MNDLFENSDTKAFFEYFQRIYSYRLKIWAYCYRFKLGINTNIHLESFKKIFKHIYLNGKKVRRLNKSINAVMKLTQNTYFKWLIQYQKMLQQKKLKKYIIKLEQIHVLEDQKSWLI